jgi:hypothetical protein
LGLLKVHFVTLQFEHHIIIIELKQSARKRKERLVRYLCQQPDRSKRKAEFSKQFLPQVGPKRKAMISKQKLGHNSHSFSHSSHKILQLHLKRKVAVG